MNIHIITIFPESFDSYFSSSIMKNGIWNWLFSLKFYKLNDFSNKKTKRVDDKSYWTHWQIISPEPLAKAIEHIFGIIWRKIPVLYLSPAWEILTQKKVEEYYNKLWNEFIIICGHYEWIDERIIELFVDYKISIWEYVVSSWELPAMVFIDSLVRQIPWVLKKESLEEESFSLKLNRQKEYPQYTKPEIFKWKSVPKILLSGNHKEIDIWKINNRT
jgi:tRNA (guanine37-N1)-methyltransferase